MTKAINTFQLSETKQRAASRQPVSVRMEFTPRKYTLPIAAELISLLLIFLTDVLTCRAESSVTFLTMITCVVSSFSFFSLFWELFIK